MSLIHLHYMVESKLTVRLVSEDKELYPKFLPAIPEEHKRKNSYCGWIITHEHVDNLSPHLKELAKVKGVDDYNDPWNAFWLVYHRTRKSRGGAKWVMNGEERAVCAVFKKNVLKHGHYVEQDCRQSLKDTREMIELLGLRTEEVPAEWYLEAPPL